jgi:hypothetical protein
MLQVIIAPSIRASRCFVESSCQAQCVIIEEASCTLSGKKIKANDTKVFFANNSKCIAFETVT